jgi:hypothetical protein
MSKKNPAIIKRDTRENWKKSKYIPEENVIIIMDNGDNTVSLMIGDGETNVNALPDLLLPAAAPMQRSSVDNDILIL